MPHLCICGLMATPSVMKLLDPRLCAETGQLTRSIDVTTLAVEWGRARPSAAPRTSAGAREDR
jgi:hypothetical protein